MKFILFIFLIISTGLSAQVPNIDKIDDAVVLIKIYDYKGQYVGHGSGFSISKEGVIVTNYHVVEGSYSMKVVFDKNGYKSTYNVDKIISGSEVKDLAKISIKRKSSSETFPYLRFATSLPKKGSECWAVGTPAKEEYMNTVSHGLVSNLNISAHPYKIQTNAEITHGSSGGALLNNKGEVIGVTSSGDGSKDGARASINFAVWVNELNNLPTINKTRLIDPNSIPCQLSFYTNHSNTAGVFLYVDGIYIGKFSKYFINNSTPTCGEAGTITRNLYSGKHKYVVYYSNSGKYFSGEVNLYAGSCKIFKVNGPVSYNYNPYSYFGYNRRTFDDKNKFEWTIYSGYSYSPYQTETSALTFPILIEKSFNLNSYAIRTNFQFSRRSSENTDSYDNVVTNSNKYFGLLMDLKWIWNRDYRCNYWIAPSLGIHRYKEYNNYYNTSYDWSTNTYNSVMEEYDEKVTSLSLSLRFGLDMYMTNRFYLTSDFGLGLNRYLSGYADFNLILGYRFNLPQIPF